MKKIMVLLLGVAVAINAMAVDYSAKAKVVLSSSGYTCELTLSEAAEYGELSGAVMNMEGRKVALYALKGTTKLQIVKGADLRNVKLGLLTDESADCNITVSSVAGAETLYIHDADENKDYALTESASYNFTATAKATNETRFSLRKYSDALDVCFKNNKLEINGNPFTDPIYVKDANGDNVAGSPFDAGTPLIDMTTIGAAGDRFTVEFNNGNRKFVIVKE